eukprot:scaffold4_cov396-Prasinococcus_capsulatus_cf.AAC.24
MAVMMARPPLAPSRALPWPTWRLAEQEQLPPRTCDMRRISRGGAGISAAAHIMSAARAISHIGALPRPCPIAREEER